MIDLHDIIYFKALNKPSMIDNITEASNRFDT